MWGSCGPTFLFPLSVFDFFFLNLAVDGSWIVAFISDVRKKKNHNSQTSNSYPELKSYHSLQHPIEEGICSAI